MPAEVADPAGDHPGSPDQPGRADEGPDPSGEPAPARSWRRRLLRAFGLGVVLAVVASVTCVAWMRIGARGHLYRASDVPNAPVALVLGAQVNPDGRPSAFLTARLTLAKQLYDTGKVRALLVSGDNSRPEYDEPTAMRRWLVEHGVPEHRVVADYAGFDTYDSCVRAKKIFGINRMIVVTQSFHVARAVTLCRGAGIAADGVGDDSVRARRWAWGKASLREYGAAVKAGLDMIIGRDPVFLGPHEPGVDDALRDG